MTEHIKDTSYVGLYVSLGDFLVMTDRWCLDAKRVLDYVPVDTKGFRYDIG